MKLDSVSVTKEYIANGETISSSVGTIPGVTLTISNSSLNATRIDGLGDTTLASGSKGVTLLGTRISTTKGNAINVTNAIFTVTGTNASTSTGHLNNVFATLYVNGSAVSSKTFNAGTITFDGFSTKVDSSTSADLVVKADLSDSFASGTLNVALTSIAATDSVTSSTVSISSVTGVTYTIAEAVANFAESDSDPRNQLLLAGSSNNEIFAFKMTANNDNIKVKDITLT
jgi:hypothetical protein